MSESPKLILCMEDDEDDRMWIQEAATEIDPAFLFIHKPNGKEGLAFLEQQKQFRDYPCLILMDINMPVMDGKQTLAAIRKDPQLTHIPIVVFTTSNSKADQFFCELYKAEMITKPAKLPDLKRKIQQVVLARCA